MISKFHHPEVKFVICILLVLQIHTSLFSQTLTIEKRNTDLNPPVFYEKVSLDSKELKLKVYEEALGYNIPCKVDGKTINYQDKMLVFEFDKMIGDNLNSVLIAKLTFTFYYTHKNAEELILDKTELIAREPDKLTFQTRICRPCSRDKFDILQYDWVYIGKAMPRVMNENYIKNSLE